MITAEKERPTVLIRFKWDILVIYFADYMRIIYCHKVKVKFDITNRLLRSDLLLMFNTFHNMKYVAPIKCYRLLKYDGTVYALDLKVKVKTWHHQWIPQMWLPIDVQYISYVYLAPISCYRLLKCAGTAYDLDLKVKVKLGITNGILRCGSLSMFNTFHMSILLQLGATRLLKCDGTAYDLDH